jgi:hypothetical protein
VVRGTIERALGDGKLFGVIAPANEEVVCFEPAEVEVLATELSSGRVSLESLATELNLSVPYVRLVLQYLLKTNKISGVLTYSDTFISNLALKKEAFAKAQAQKRNCRRKHGLI